MIYDHTKPGAEAQQQCMVMFAIFGDGGNTPPTSYNFACNNGCNDSILTGPTDSKRACFLTQIGFEDTDGGNEWAGCESRISGAMWELAAWADEDSDAYCSSFCIRWNY